MSWTVAMGEIIYVDEDEPLVDVEDLPFAPRNVQVRNDKWITDEYDIYEILGRGKFGVVSRCTEKASGVDFAAKLIATPTPQDREDVVHEVDIMKMLQHRRLIQLYDAFSTRDEMCLVLEVVMGGELFDRVICEDFVLTEKACVCFVRQICEGLEYMHSTNIIHLDMKPENVLCLSKTGNRIKIIDFGLAREYCPGKDLRVLFGTPEFMAPEVVNYEPISFATDMWSIGVICYVLLSGLSPFMGDNDGDTLTNIIKCDYDFDYKEFDEVSDDAQDFIESLLVIDQKKRLTSRQCLDHIWLKRTMSTKLSPNKTKLKQYVYKRRWQKAFHVLIALKRMGCDIKKLNKSQSFESMRPMIPPKPRMINVSEFFNKGKENFMKKDRIFNAIMTKCDKTNEQQSLDLGEKDNQKRDKVSPTPQLPKQQQQPKVKLELQKPQQQLGGPPTPEIPKVSNPTPTKDAHSGYVPKPVQNVPTKPVAPFPSKFPQTNMFKGKAILEKKSPPENNQLVTPGNCPQITITTNGNKGKHKPMSLDSLPAYDMVNSKESSYIEPQSPKTILQDDFHITVKGDIKCNGPKFSGEINLNDSKDSTEEKPKRPHRTSSGASCTSDASDSTKDENKNKVGAKDRLPYIPSVADRIRALQEGHQKTLAQQTMTKYEAPKRPPGVHHVAQKVCKKWQKGNDRYIVVNRVQDAVKFFTVDDQRELISSGYSRSRETSPNTNT